VSLLQRLLLLPLLSPLLAVLLLGVLNPRPWVALRLLTWTSPAWPLGAWISAAGVAGAALSAAGAGLALNSGTALLGERRQVRRRAGGDAEERAGSAPGAEPAAEPAERGGRANWSAWAGPSRGAAEPPPTVSVPFRVIRKGRGPAAAAAAPAPAAAATSPAQAAAVGDGWDSSGGEEW